MIEFDGVVLAGGQSRRFGHDKASVPFLNTTLVGNAVDILRRSGCSRVVVLHRRPHDLEGGIVPSDVEVAVDDGGGQGPLDGLITALSLARSEWVVTLPVDQPLVTPDLVVRMIDTARRSSSTTDAVSVVDEAGQRHHLTSVWRRDSGLTVMRRRFLDGERSPRAVLEDLSCLWLEHRQRDLVNVNTPEDLIRATASVDEGS